MTQVKLGDKNISFIYQGKELLYPNPIKDGLVLYYDFKGMKNSDMTKGVAKDLSGNGNNGTLSNFAYTSGSGYNDGLKFDGIDDYGIISLKPSFRNTTYEFTLKWAGQTEGKAYQVLMQPNSYWADGVFMSHGNIRTSVKVDGGYKSVEYPMTDYLNKNILVTRVLDSDNKVLKLFINGIKVGEKNLPMTYMKKLTNVII